MSGFKTFTTNQDLDSIFEPRISTDPSAQQVSYKTFRDQKSLSERYLPYTSGTKATATGFKVFDTNGNTLDLSDVYAKLIPRSWNTLGSGLAGATINGFAIAALDASNILVGGQFTSAGGVACNNIAKWNIVDSSWSPLGIGTTDWVRTIYMWDMSTVYVGGTFTSAGGVSNTGRIARWNARDLSWSALGPGLNNVVRSVYAANPNNVYAGGDFTLTGDTVTSLSRVAKWNGSTWSTLGTGVNASVYAVYASDASNVYVGGTFTTASGVTANRIAKWSAIDVSWSTLGSGANAVVSSIDGFDANNIYVGGSFTTLGNVSNTCIAKWNGTAFETMGSGTLVAVTTIRAFNPSYVYVGGQFTTTGGVTTNHIARWNAVDASWSALGSGVTTGNYVYAIYAYHPSNLFIAGVFSSPSGNVARWN